MQRCLDICWKYLNTSACDVTLGQEMLHITLSAGQMGSGLFRCEALLTTEKDPLKNLKQSSPETRPSPGPRGQAET